MDPTPSHAGQTAAAVRSTDTGSDEDTLAGPRLILASGSPRRRQFLSWLGFDHRVEPADVDETPAVGEAPREYAARIAVAKATAGRATAEARGERGVVVLAADTIVISPDGEILGKPSDRAGATAMLRGLSGRQHVALTAHCVAVSEPAANHAVELAETTVSFRDLSDEEIDRYVATDEPLDKAGAYGIQGAGGLLIDRIEGSPANVAGLCPATTLRLLGSIHVL